MLADLRERATARMYAEALHRDDREMVCVAARSTLDRQVLDAFTRDARNVECHGAFDGLTERRGPNIPLLREPARRRLHAEAEFAEAGGILRRGGRREGAWEFFPRDSA